MAKTKQKMRHTLMYSQKKRNERVGREDKGTASVRVSVIRLVSPVYSGANVNPTLILIPLNP